MRTIIDSIITIKDGLSLGPTLTNLKNGVTLSDWILIINQWLFKRKKVQMMIII